MSPNVSVRERPKPEYDPAGVKLGAFTAFPGVTTYVANNDNIFAVDTATIDDTVYAISPVLTVRSDWSRNALALVLQSTSRWHNERDLSSTSEYSGRLSGDVDIGDSVQVSSFTSYANAREEYFDTPTTVTPREPVEFESVSFGLSATKSFSNTRVKVSASSDRYNFQDTVDFALAPIDQDIRDRTVTQGIVHVDQALGAASLMFVEIRYGSRDYKNAFAPIDLSSDGYEALVGIGSDVTQLIHGQIGVGYLHQAYDQAGVEDTSSFAANAQLEWFVDEIVTISLNADRTIADSGIAFAPAIIHNSARLGVDYELRRSVILGAAINYISDDFQGLDRKDDRSQVGLSVDYAIRRGMSLRANYDWMSQTSEGVARGRSYDANVFKLALQFSR